MKIYKQLLLILMVLYFNNKPLMGREILEILSPVITSLMKEKNVPEIQLLIFNPKEIKSLQYKMNFIDQNKDIIILNKESDYDRFFISELSYPFINFLIELKKNQINPKLKEISNDDPILKSIYDSLLNLKQPKIYFYNIDSSSKNELNNSESLLMDCLLNMLCGIELSKKGISLKNSNDNEKYHINIIDTPFQHFYLSTYNYFILDKLLNHTFDNSLQYINQFINSLELKHTFIYTGNVNSDFLNQNKIVRGSFSDKKITYIPDLEILNALSYGMVSNVYDYYKILRILISHKYIFNGFYTVDMRTGGYRNGFFYRKSCDDQYYIVESFGVYPGIRTYVFLMQNGFGFILFQSSDNEYILNFLREQIENLYYRILNINCNFQNLNEKEKELFTGYYRPLNVVDTTVSLFSDIWIRENASGQMEISNFFNKDPVGYLYNINQYNYFYFLGQTRLNRYPVVFKNDSEKKLIISIYEYKKIYWFQSIRGIIIIFSGFILLVSIGLIKFILKRFDKNKK